MADLAANQTYSIHRHLPGFTLLTLARITAATAGITGRHTRLNPCGHIPALSIHPIGHIHAGKADFANTYRLPGRGQRQIRHAALVDLEQGFAVLQQTEVFQGRIGADGDRRVLTFHTGAGIHRQNPVGQSQRRLALQPGREGNQRQSLQGRLGINTEGGQIAFPGMLQCAALLNLAATFPSECSRLTDNQVFQGQLTVRKGQGLSRLQSTVSKAQSTAVHLQGVQPHDPVSLAFLHLLGRLLGFFLDFLHPFFSGFPVRRQKQRRQVDALFIQHHA